MQSDEPRSIVIDPRVAFGRPVLAGTGIPTALVAERYKAGETMEDLAKDYERDRVDIEEAVRCELNSIRKPPESAALPPTEVPGAPPPGRRAGGRRPLLVSTGGERGYTSRMVTISERLRQEDRDRLRRMTPEERLAEALALGDEAIDAYAAANGVDREEARRRLEQAGQAGRRPSRVMRSLAS